MEKSEEKQKKQDKNKQNFWKNGAILVLAVLVVGSFIIFSGGDNNSNLTGNVIATVNGEKITSEEVEAIQQLFVQQGQQISEEDALEQVINQELISQEMKKGDYSISTEEAESIIKEQIAMQGASLEDYKQQLSQQGISYEEQLDSIKEELAVQKYLETQLEGESFEVSEEETREFYEMYEQQSPEEIPSYDELEPEIIATLKQQKQQEAVNILIQELRGNAEIEYLQEVDSKAEAIEEMPIEGEIPVEITE
jgi:hypothetical protein